MGFFRVPYHSAERTGFSFPAAPIPADLAYALRHESDICYSGGDRADRGKSAEEYHPGLFSRGMDTDVATRGKRFKPDFFPTNWIKVEAKMER